MCGIMCYIGQGECADIILSGLKRLEYRGYDSAGIAVVEDNQIFESKSVGKLSVLSDILAKNPIKGKIGIGHTRWATHGSPSDLNAHPHSDCKGTIAVVHNGIIENCLSLKKSLEKRGHVFRSETDTEVIAHLIEGNYKGDLYKAVYDSIKELQGSYAIAVVCKDEPDLIVAAKKDSPLVIGIGDGENFIASDIPAFLSYTRKAIILEEGEMAVVTKDDVRVFTEEGLLEEPQIIEVLWDAKMAEKGGYKHFMQKEIYEQPKVIYDTLSGRIDKNQTIKFDELEISESYFKDIKKVFVVACGTAFHAGMIGKYLIECIAKVPVEVDLASEFRYRDVLLDENTLFLVVSQSGETADSLAAARLAKKKGVKVVSICNVMGSTLARESDGVIFTRAGIEIGVAATKTFSGQMLIFYLFALYLAQVRGIINSDEKEEYFKELLAIPQKIDLILNSHNQIKKAAQRFYKCKDFLFLGRYINFPIALEGALKLKEISYIHAEGYAAGELKHGPIALIDDSVPIITALIPGRVYDKVLSNVREVKAREAITMGIAVKGDRNASKYFDYVYYIPPVGEIFSPLLTIIPLQLLSYYIADYKGCDVDQPRNLAKSVTVE